MKTGIQKKLDFLEALARTGSVARAARDAGLNRRGLYKMKQREPEFAKAWERQLRWSEQMFKLEERAVEEADYGSISMLKFMLKDYIPRVFMTEREDDYDGEDEEAAQAIPAGNNGVN